MVVMKTPAKRRLRLGVPQTAHASTVDPAEIARFAAIAEEWWDPDGKFRPIHRLNPARMAFLRDRLCAQFERDPKRPRPLAGLLVLDIGCGGGLVSEPLTRLGATVTGIDADATTIGVARAHAEGAGLQIAYETAAAEDLATRGAQFDAVCALEIIEHVADLGAFAQAASALTRPGGALVFATLNRTAKSFVLGILAAEYLLRWLPRGTHEWRKFVRPSELDAALRPNGVRLTALQGLFYDVLADDWRLADDMAVNYLAFAVKDPA